MTALPLEGVPPYMVQPETNPSLIQQLNRIVAELTKATGRETKHHAGTLKDFILSLTDEGQVPCFVLGAHICSNIAVILIERHLKPTLLQGKSSKTSPSTRGSPTAP